MVSPDSGQRFHPGPELLVPIEGNFAGKDVLSMTQFDQTSLDRLSSVTARMKETLRTRTTPAILQGVIIISAFDEMSINKNTIKSRLPFESSVLRLGGPNPIHQELPRADDPEFDYKILDIKAASPDAVIITHPQEEFVLRVASVFRSVRGITPLINARVFESVDRNSALAELLEDGVALRMALLGLVLDKVK